MTTYDISPAHPRATERLIQRRINECQARIRVLQNIREVLVAAKEDVIAQRTAAKKA